jgi:tRNA U55 pseudouridine synthase TruB
MVDKSTRFVPLSAPFTRVGYGLASEATWNELVKSLARDLAYSLKEELYWAHYQRLRAQEATSEKLVYLHLLRSQPQTFSGILRSLDLSSYTIDKALRRLRVRGHVVQDSSYLYWVSKPEPDR